MRNSESAARHARRIIAKTSDELVEPATAPGRGEFCQEHFSWLCQAGQGQCPRGTSDQQPMPTRPSSSEGGEQRG